MVVTHVPGRTQLIEKMTQEVEAIDLELLQKEAGIWKDFWGYYLWGTYPPLIGLENLNGTKLLEGNAQKEFDVYVHIPFCEHECSFCHFYHVTSSQLQELTTEDETVVSYLDALESEISMLRERITGKDKIKARSIYIGGGTPTFLSASQMRRLLRHIRDNFGLGTADKPVTFTFDVHPKIFNRDEKLGVLHEFGVNRISIGGASLNDKVLAAQNRGHTGRDVINLITTLKEMGFPHIVTDLIMGLPYQTLQSWMTTIEHLIENEVDSIMTFPLMLKASARLCARALTRSAEFPSMKDRMIMQLLAMDLLTQSDYIHDPLFYFNRKKEHENDQQKRKFKSIEETGLLAVGASSFGFVNRYQYYNTPCITDYIAKVRGGILPVWKGTMLSRRNLFERAIIFGLRSGKIDKDQLREKYSFDIDDEYAIALPRLQKCGLIESTSKSLELTRLGILFADEVSTKFAGNDVIENAEKTARTLPVENSRQVLSFGPPGHKAHPKTVLSKTRMKCNIACNTCK